MPAANSPLIAQHTEKLLCEMQKQTFDSKEDSKDGKGAASGASAVRCVPLSPQRVGIISEVPIV
jgi:hypothetical protein